MEIPKGPLNITRTKTPAKGLNERSIVLQDAWPAQRPQAASHEVVGERELEAAEQADVVVAQGREPLALCTGYASLDPTGVEDEEASINPVRASLPGGRIGASD